MASQFFPLPPQGLGTGDIEALDSYILRLATEHGVTEYQFHRLLAWWWNNVKSGDQGRLGRHIGYISKVGYGNDIDTLVQALEKGTGYAGLSSLTLSAFRDICGTHVGCQSRHVHAWCPACLRDRVQTSLPIYEKLAWRLNAISRCEVHKLALESMCPWCGQHQLRHVDTWPNCSECGQSLIAKERLWRPSFRASDGETDLLDVITYCSEHPGTVFHRDAARKFWELIRNDGTLRCHPGYEYFHKRPKPTKTLVSVLLRFAREVNVPLLSILLDPVQAASIRTLPWDDPQRGPCLPRESSRLSTSQRKALERRLKSYLKYGKTHRSLNRLCSPYPSTSNARYWFPDLVHAVIEKNKALKKSITKKHEQSLERLCLDVQLVMKADVLGWHKVEAQLSEQLSIPIHRVRKRLSGLKRDAQHD